MALEPVATLSDVPENGTYALEHEGIKLLLVRSPSGVFAIENMCSHAYQELHGGKIKKVFIFCPMHGVRFDLRNGCPSGSLTDKPIKTWHAEMDGKNILVDMEIRLDNGE